MTDAIDWHTQIADGFADAYNVSPRFKERMEVWGDLIIRYGRKGGRALDAGCGPGLMSAAASRSAQSVVAFDASPKMVENARVLMQREHIDNVVVRHASLGDAKIAALGPFDLVMCSSVLEYVEDLDWALDWLADHIAPGGTLLVSMPNKRSTYRAIERAAYSLLGRPPYLAYVRHVVDPAAFSDSLSARGLSIPDLRFFGAAPLLSAMARPIGQAQFADTLFVVAASRPTTGR